MAKKAAEKDTEDAEDKPAAAPAPAGAGAGYASLPVAYAAAVQQHDPDILLAWDVRRASLGYALERAAVLGMRPPLVRLLGRMPDSDDGDARARRDPWGEQHGSMDLAQR